MMDNPDDHDGADTNDTTGNAEPSDKPKASETSETEVAGEALAAAEVSDEADHRSSDDTSAESTDIPPTTAERIRLGSPSIKKLACLAALAIATLIPTAMISNLVGEREERANEVQTEIAQSFGPAQLVAGPVVLMPVDTQTANYMRIVPRTLDAKVEMEPSQRHRGFFGATVYTASIHLSGSVAVLDSMRTGDNKILSLPDKAFLAVSVTDPRGVASGDGAAIAYGASGGSKAAWQLYDDRGGKGCRTRGQVLAVPVDLGKARADLTFDAILHLQGTQGFQLGPTAKETTATIKSAWPSPSFTGNDAPARTNVTSDGFDAQWHVGGIGDQRISASECAADIGGSPIGVDLIDAMPIYRMVTRAAKYGPLFVALAFATYFLFEMVSGIAISVLQYGLLATSLSLFALLLVSLGEFTGYAAGYAIAAALVIAQASIFTVSVVRRLRPGLGFAALLTGLFGFLYVLLGLESLALLTGAIALFVTVSIVMAVTQKVGKRDAATL